MRRLILVGLIAVAGATVLFPWSRQALVPFQLADGPERVKRARANQEEHLRNLCREAGLAYPPENLFLRAFKADELLEVWAGSPDQPLTLLTYFDWTATSGRPGPKRQEGDRQIPEGCYVIDRFNPKSSFHLSLGLNYPNPSDKAFADPERPGGDIFIHGWAASVGCIAIGNEAIEQLFVLATDVQARGKGPIHVHIFPTRIGPATWNEQFAEAVGADPAIKEFWENLEPVYQAFQGTNRVPKVSVNSKGRYEVLAY